MNAYWAQFYFCFILLIFVIDVSEFCSLPVIGPGRRKAKLFSRFPLTWWWLEVSHSPGKIPGPCSSHYANNVNCILGCTGSSRAPCPSQRKENSPWGSLSLGLAQASLASVAPHTLAIYAMTSLQLLISSPLCFSVGIIHFVNLSLLSVTSPTHVKLLPESPSPQLRTLFVPPCRTCARSFHGIIFSSLLLFLNWSF